MNASFHDSQHVFIYVSQLFRQALDTRNKTWGPVEFHRFEASSQYGHKYIFRAPELPTLVNEFVKSYQNETF